MLEDLDTAPCGFIIFTDEGTIVEVNHTLWSMLEYPNREALIGRNIETIFTIAGRIFYQTHFFPLVKMQGSAEEIFFIVRGKNGKETPMIWNARRKETDGKLVNHCVLFRAVQRGEYEERLLLARKKAEAALQENLELITAKDYLEKHAIELDRRLSQLQVMSNDMAQFGRIISHDLQETIRKIGVFADKVATQNAEILGDNTVKDLHKINTECRRMRALTAQLEKFISLNTDTGSFQDVDLNRFFSSLNGAELKAARLPVVKGNEQQLSLLFEQVLANSVAYQHDDRALKISVTASLIQQNSFKEIKGKYRYSDFVQLTISDNGKGFALDNPDDAFSIRRKEGDGLLKLSFGLAFVKKIVDNHFGFVNIRSVPGEGTTLTIYLPATLGNQPDTHT